MSAIEVKNLSKSYQVYRKKEGLIASITGLFHREYETIQAVRDVSFTVETGEVVAFLGPNGAGKTTTLKLLSGLIYPSSGSARVLDYVPWKRQNAYRRRFSLVMGQKNQLWWDLPAQESFRLHKEIYRIDTKAFDDRVTELTELLEVTKQVSQPVRELSLGERMRMELIAALLHSPEVLLLDEPTIGLDVVSQKKVQEFLKHYQSEKKITVLLTSHYMKDVEALCKRAVIINEGEIKFDGPLLEVIDLLNTSKIISLQFEQNEIPNDLDRYGEVIETEPPKARLKVSKEKIPEILSSLLGRYRIEDVGVQERPLEEVIADVFSDDTILKSRVAPKK